MLLIFGRVPRFWDETEMSFREVAQLGLATFGVVAYVEIMTVLGLTPVLVAGVIADETQRKTLHFVLSTPLPSSEIVLGKMLSRLLHIGVFIAIIVPVMAILSLAGGVDPTLQLALIAGSASTGFLLASVALLASTLAGRVRDAVFLSYAVEGPMAGRLATHHLAILVDLRPGRTRRGRRPELRVGMALANDPAGRRSSKSTASIAEGPTRSSTQSGGWSGCRWPWGSCSQPWPSPSSGRPSAAASRVSRPRLADDFASYLPCSGAIAGLGDWPMVWKERGARSRGVVRLATLALGLGLVTFTAYFVFKLSIPAFDSFWHGANGGQFMGPVFEFSMAIRTLGTLWGGLAMMAVCGAASASVTSEKEGDTWTSLMTTDLSTHEILVGKAIGALYAALVPAFMLASIVLTGLVCGSLHPLGAIAFTLLVVIYTSFAASLGLHLSLRCRDDLACPGIRPGHAADAGLRPLLLHPAVLRQPLGGGRLAAGLDGRQPVRLWGALQDVRLGRRVGDYLRVRRNDRLCRRGFTPSGPRRCTSSRPSAVNSRGDASHPPRPASSRPTGPGSDFLD